MRPWSALLGLTILMSSVSLASGQVAPGASLSQQRGIQPRGVAGEALPQGPAAPPAAAQMFRPPEWASTLSPQHIKWRDDILKYWENRTNQISTYSCNFERFDYDPIATPWNPAQGALPAKQISTGVIKYAAPDKAFYRDLTIQVFDGAQQPPYKAISADEAGAHWVCNGGSVFEYDYASRILKETILPPSFQGAAISERGPLPFLFNAKADRIMERYWIRVITPQGKEGEYWLESVPKHQREAADYKMIHLIIEQKDYLPKAMIIFDRTYAPAKPARTTFVFKDRKVNEFNVRIFCRNAGGATSLTSRRLKTGSAWSSGFRNRPRARGRAARRSGIKRRRSAVQRLAPLHRRRQISGKGAEPPADQRPGA